MCQVGAGELIVYEVPLRTFTAHPNSAVGDGKQGTFLGFLEKVRQSSIPGGGALPLLPAARNAAVHNVWLALNHACSAVHLRHSIMTVQRAQPVELPCGIHAVRHAT